MKSLILIDFEGKRLFKGRVYARVLRLHPEPDKEGRIRIHHAGT